ncbi:MAG: replication initiation protein, partial [Bacteroidetes bacterium]|nr:replication initiation protein [Bacteroidota bacterium]
EIRQLFKLKSFYSYRLYWLLKQYSTFGERYIDTDDLREMLNIQDKYDRFQDFKVKVINVAMKELRNTDMGFTYELVKKGKRVVGVKFLFAQSETLNLLAETTGQQNIFASTEPEEQRVEEMALTGKVSVRDTLEKFKLSNLQINKIIQRVSSEDIYKTAYQINLRLLDNGNLSPAAYAYSEFERRFFSK